MRAGVKAAVVLLPFLAVFLALRACAGGEAARWVETVRAFDPETRLVLDEEELIVLAPDEALGRRAGVEIRGFRAQLLAEYGDLLGRPADQRMVVVLFSSADILRRYAGDRMRHDPDYAARIYGYTDPLQGAIFLPPDEDFATLRHETVHWVVGAALGALPSHSPWLSEGLAQLFETYDPRASPPRPPGIGRRDRLQMRARLPRDTLDVDRLLALDDYAAFVKGDAARNYLEALVLTAFLFETRRDDLRQYIEEEWGSSRREDAFRFIFRPREPAFRDGLSAFIRRTKAP